MNNLLDCPLCGETGQIKDVHGKFRSGWVGCPKCSLYIQWKVSPAGAVAKWNNRVTVKANVFDSEEIIRDCVVQILRNSVTGETSVGWWKNDSPPAGMEDDDEQ